MIGESLRDSREGLKGTIHVLIKSNEGLWVVDVTVVQSISIHWNACRVPAGL